MVDLVPKNSLHLQWLPEPLINSTMPKNPHGPRATGPEGPCELRTAESKGEAVVDGGGVLRGFFFLGNKTSLNLFGGNVVSMFLSGGNIL